MKIEDATAIDVAREELEEALENLLQSLRVGALYADEPLDATYAYSRYLGYRRSRREFDRLIRTILDRDLAKSPDRAKDVEIAIRTG